MGQHEPLSPEQIGQRLDALRADFDGAEVIYRRANKVILRQLGGDTRQSVIVKLWSRPDLRGRMRQYLRIGASHHEWSHLVRLRKSGLSVPYPLGFSAISPAIAGYTEALFTEDLGDCESATMHLQRLIRTGQEQKALQFEDVLIDMTVCILDAGIIDVDHGLVNTVVLPTGRAVRLDFELARHVLWPRIFKRTYGQMLGHLILLHGFAVQPQIDRTTHFAGRLIERLKPHPRTLRVAKSYIEKYMQRQCEVTGIDTRLILPWP